MDLGDQRLRISSTESRRRSGFRRASSGASGLAIPQSGQTNNATFPCDSDKSTATISNGRRQLGHSSSILKLLIATPFQPNAKCLGWRPQFAAEPARCFKGHHRVDKFDYTLMDVIACGAFERSNVKARGAGGFPCQRSCPSATRASAIDDHGSRLERAGALPNSQSPVSAYDGTVMKRACRNAPKSAVQYCSVHWNFTHETFSRHFRSLQQLQHARDLGSGPTCPRQSSRLRSTDEARSSQFAFCLRECNILHVRRCTSNI